jgi:hypothetical protein
LHRLRAFLHHGALHALLWKLRTLHFLRTRHLLRALHLRLALHFLRTLHFTTIKRSGAFYALLRLLLNGRALRYTGCIIIPSASWLLTDLRLAIKAMGRLLLLRGLHYRVHAWALLPRLFRTTAPYIACRLG